MDFYTDIATANEAVCESLATAAAELDKRIASRARCTCKGSGYCLACMISYLNRKYTRAA